MKNSKTIINIGIVILIILLAGAIYFYLTGSDEAPGVGISAGAVDTQAGTTLASADTSEFLILLDSLQTVDLGGKIFQNKIFASELQNFATEIPSRPQGRSNPFAPIGTANLAPVDTTDTGTGGVVDFGASNN